MTVRIILFALFIVAAMRAAYAYPNHSAEGHLACGGAQFRLGTLSSVSIEDRMSLPMHQSLWVKPPGATKEIAVDLREPAYTSRHWRPGTHLLAAKVYAWDCRPRRVGGPIVVLWYTAPQEAVEPPPLGMPDQGREWNLALTLDGHLLDHDIQENWPDQSRLHLLPD